MSSERIWPENCWYVVAMSSEITDRPLGRTVCDKPMVLYRNEHLVITVLEDFCPHRGLPLSQGSVNQGKLTCGYHGLVVNCDGSCHSMRGQEVTRMRGINPYPAVERYDFIWVWPGDPNQADPALIPNLSWANSNEWTYGGDYYLMKCDYRLLIDNLMDLTHETYVHADSIGQPEIEESEPVVSNNTGEVTVTRMMHGITPPPFWQEALTANNAQANVPCDRWQVCRFIAPSQVLIDVGVAHADYGAQAAPANRRAAGIVVDFITPESATTCHYFWGMARSFNIKDQQLTDSLRKNQGRIFAEDKAILEGQQASLLRNPTRRLMSLNIDAGGVYARRVIKKMIDAETQT